MAKFYTSAASNISHVDGNPLVKNLLPVLRDTAEKPISVLNRSSDFFGGELDKGDMTMLKLQEGVIDETMFSQMMTSCLCAIAGVLERQYSRYFQLDISGELEKETSSARLHN